MIKTKTKTGFRERIIKDKNKYLEKYPSQENPNSSGEGFKMGAKDVKLSLTEEHQVVNPSLDKLINILKDIEKNNFNFICCCPTCRNIKNRILKVIGEKEQ